MDDPARLRHLGTLEAALQDVAPDQAVTVGLCCLTRQLPIYERACAERTDKVPLRLRACLDHAWEVVREDAISPGAFDRPTALEEPEAVDETPALAAINLIESTAGDFLRAMQAGVWHRAYVPAETAFSLLDLLGVADRTRAGLADDERSRQIADLADLERGVLDKEGLRERAEDTPLFGEFWYEDHGHKRQ